MKLFTKVTIASIVALGFTASAATAEIVCNDEGECWHVKSKHEYKPEFGVRVYNDDWKWADNDSKKYRWREHDGEGRGYWKKGIWLDF